jgi:hypothetical protein
MDLHAARPLKLLQFSNYPFGAVLSSTSRPPFRLEILMFNDKTNL